MAETLHVGIKILALKEDNARQLGGVAVNIGLNINKCRHFTINKPVIN